jgi:hypothetical protein
MNEHRTALHLGDPVEMLRQSYWGGDVTGCSSCLSAHSREKGDEAQRIEMLAASPSLTSPYANFLCKNLELQEC